MRFCFIRPKVHGVFAVTKLDRDVLGLAHQVIIGQNEAVRGHEETRALDHLLGFRRLAPAPAAFLEASRSAADAGADSIVSVHISADMSSTTSAPRTTFHLLASHRFADAWDASISVHQQDGFRASGNSQPQRAFCVGGVVQRWPDLRLWSVASCSPVSTSQKMAAPSVPGRSRPTRRCCAAASAQ